MKNIVANKQLKKKLKEKEQEITPTKIYLILYNALQFGGW